MSTIDNYMESYLADRDGAPIDIDRLVEQPSGLSHEDMPDALVDPRLTERGLEVMADFMHPKDSVYFDAIYGPQHGQKNIRGWLIPVMQEISFIKFEPTAEPVFLDDGMGGTTVDEWMMVAEMGDQRLPLSRGISVRWYRDGWITHAADYYDTNSFRMPGAMAEAPPPEAGADAPAPIPDWPRAGVPEYDGPVVVPSLSPEAEAWIESRVPGPKSAPSGLSSADIHALIHSPVYGEDFDLQCDLMHPTDSIYIDPIFGDFKGQADIRAWLTDIMGKVGNIRFKPMGPLVIDGDVSVQEWEQMAVQPDGTEIFMTRGASVRKVSDGWITYSADYFDAAPLMDEDIQKAGIAAGSTITAEDVMKYRGA